jgi:hypothetical protein
MRAGRLPLDEQIACQRAALDLNRTLGEVLSGAAAMNLPVLATRHVYGAKTARWRGQWPGLTVLPWPATTDGSADPQERPR